MKLLALFLILPLSTLACSTSNIENNQQSPTVEEAAILSGIMPKNTETSVEYDDSARAQFGDIPNQKSKKQTVTKEKQDLDSEAAILSGL